MDQVEIETPELIALELPLAGVGSRAVALLCDIILQFLLMVAVILLLGVIGFPPFGPKDPWVAAVAVLAALVVYTGYYAIFEVVWSGRTPGKKLVGIRVIKEDGRNLTVLEAILRNLIRLVDQLPMFYLVGFVTMLIDKRNRRLGDMVAGSLVVHESRSATTDVAWTGGENAVPLPAAARAQLGRLTLQDLELIETFLNRRLDLSAAVREKAEAQVVQRMSERLRLPVEEQMGGGLNFLEALARELRDHLRYR